MLMKAIWSLLSKFQLCQSDYSRAIYSDWTERKKKKKQKKNSSSIMAEDFTADLSLHY